MNINELDEFNGMFEGLCAYYDRKASPMLAEIYWRGLSAYDFKDVRRAFDAHMHNADTGQFMPKIADVERYIHGNSSARSMRAWMRVANAIQRVGTYESVAFDDPLIHACIEDMGGWHQMGIIENDDLPFKIREFEKRYTAYTQVAPARTVPMRLIGIFEQTNSMLCHHDVRGAIMIADAEQAEERVRVAMLNAPRTAAQVTDGSLSTPLQLKAPPEFKSLVDKLTGKNAAAGI